MVSRGDFVFLIFSKGIMSIKKGDLIQNKPGNLRVLFLYLNRKATVVLLALCSVSAYAQQDSTYVKSFQFQYAARAFVAKNTFSLNVESEIGEGGTFTPNNPVLLGLGFSWKNSSLSFGYGFSSMREKDKGKTKTLDLQYHHYGERWIVDLYLLKNKGFYLEDKDVPQLYPDLKISLYGAFAQYVFSGDKFSFGAAFDQNKRQLRSAGSWLLGGNVFYTNIKGQPMIDNRFYGNDKWNIQLGPNGGYAYSWVFAPNFYLAGSFSMGVNVGIEKENEQRKFSVNPLLFSRASVGYNGRDWTVNISALNNRVYVKFTDEYQRSLDPSQYKITFVKRFDLKKEISFLKKDLKFPAFSK